MSSITSTSYAVTARIAERLAESLGQRKFAMWFDQSAHFNYEPNDRRLTVNVPNRFVADWIGRNFEQDLHNAASSEIGADFELNVCVDPECFNRAAAAPQSSSNEPAPAHHNTAANFAPAPIGSRMTTSPPHQAPAPQHLTNQPPTPNLPHTPQATAHNTVVMPRPTSAAPSFSRKLRHSLDTFVVGPSNELAYSAASRVAEDDATIAGTPLFIHGGCGLGKTHLLQGIVNKYRSRNPQAKVHYCTGEQFTNEYITAVRTNKLDQFRRRMRQMDLLAVDDIHFIANKSSTQQEFLHCFDHIELSGSNVVLASDSHPKLIKQFTEALVSRCVRGMVVQIHEPDEETRIRIVRALADRRQMIIQPSAARELAMRADGSVREIEGLLTKLHAFASLGGSRSGGLLDPVGHALINRLFEAEEKTGQRRKPIRFNDIVDTVSVELEIEQAKILGTSRNKHIVLARSIAIYLARNLTSMSYPEIATAMGRKTHSTVITATQRMQRQIDENAPILLPTEASAVTPKELVDRIKRTLKRAPIA
ncbi:chromosomal replication initiator protein DnaA [Planctomycetota bacterium]|nr:chromosomal replication initiator protein DnaA [Planctomycetota bacterium]